MNILKHPTFIPRVSLQALLIVLAFVLAIIIAASFFVFPTIYAPLYVFAGVMAVLCLIIWLRKPIWALYFTIFLVLLPDSLIPAQLNSYMNRVATVISLAVWVAYAIRERRKVIITKSTLFILFFILWAAITLLWAENFDYGWDILQRYVLRLVLFLLLIINEIDSKKNLNGFMYTLALSGLLLVIVSGISILTQGYSSGSRLSVLGENENGLGLSLLISLQGVLWWALQPSKHNNLVKKFLAAIFFLAAIGITGLSGSRGTAISLVATLGVFLLWKLTRPWGVFGFLIIGCGVLLAPILFSTTIARFLGTTGESMLGGREALWVAGWDLIKDHLITGVGIANSQFRVTPYLASFGGIDLSLLRIESSPVHNPIIAIWADTGLIGLSIYLIAFFTPVVSFIKKYIQYRRTMNRTLLAYYAIVSSVFIGYILSWIKGGGMESDFTYFLMIGLLWIPSYLHESSPNSILYHEKTD
jgi:O-antigen ligase